MLFRSEVPAAPPAEVAVPTPTAPAVEEPSAAGTPETVRPEDTPLHRYLSGINPALDQYYAKIISPPLESVPQDQRRNRILLDGFNETIQMLQDALARWDHPAITGKTHNERAIAKSKATATDRQLLDAPGTISAIATRAANQMLALDRGYKGRRAGSVEKIDAAEDEAFKELENYLKLMYERDLLTPELKADYEEMVGGKKEEEPAASVEPKAKISFNPKEKTDEQLEDIVDDVIGV